MVKEISLSGRKPAKQAIRPFFEKYTPRKAPARVGRHIVLFLDGTGNTPEELCHPWPRLSNSGKPNYLDIAQIDPPPITNVIRLMRGVVTDDTQTSLPQIVHYLRGVGTEGSLITQKEDMVTGSGLSRNILEAYRFISHNLEWGVGDHVQLGRDKIFIFGFSRGAYTARALCGFLHRVGLLKKKHLWMLPFLFEHYQQLLYYGKDFDEKTKGILADAVQQEYRSIPVHFLGVWDTVATLGYQGISRWTFNYEPFFDTSLTPNVTYAYQALAIHELRKQFNPVFWTKLGNSKQTLEQVWFAGAHSNVGGGYKQTGLSNYALDWMAYKAKKAGLTLDTPYFQEELQHLPTGYTEPVALPRIWNHGKGGVSLPRFPKLIRPISLNDINNYLQDQDIGGHAKRMDDEVFKNMKIHWSVEDRLATQLQYTAECSYFKQLDSAVQELQERRAVVDRCCETLFPSSRAASTSTQTGLSDSASVEDPR
jgi:hypothetical protein